ncbi:rod shape-determining protein MreC [Ectothiorhodospiraceae bacterium BW-2]|nr:rod shape-determining protein MreC [Ectothiorhodospiraceae bacterium BW-2]
MNYTLFIQGPSLVSRLLLVVGLSIVFMVSDHHSTYLDSVRTGLSTLLYPLRYLVNLPVSATSSFSETFASRELLLQQNRELRHKQLLLEVRMQKMAAIEQENRRLRAMLKSSKEDWERVLVAEMVAVDSDPYRHRMKINRGIVNGVFIGHPVIDALGVVGQVVATDTFHSDLLLITDPSHSLPVRVLRNGLRAVAVGSGKHLLDIPHLPNNADIREGDLLVTSGLGQRFPADYPVARVVTIRRDPARTFAQVEAEPTAKLQQAQELLLIWSEPVLAAEDDAGG